MGSTDLQGLSTDPEGQEIQIRPEEDLPKECLQSVKPRIKEESVSDEFEEKGKRNVKNTAEDGVNDNFWDYFESDDSTKSEDNVFMATSGHQGADK